MSGESKWLVVLKAEVTAKDVGEAREKTIGPFGTLENCRIRLLEFKRLKGKQSKNKA